MILYNVTIKIITERKKDWESWMKVKHIPDVMATGCFSEFKLSKMMGEDETQGITYAIQYLAPSRDHYMEYQAKHALRLQEEHKKRYENQYVAFRTLLEVIDQS